MSVKKYISRLSRVVLAVVLGVHAGNATALEFDIAGTKLQVDSLFSIGGTWRMQDRDWSLIGKSNLYAMQNPGSRTGLCLSRASGTAAAGPSLNEDDNEFIAGVIGRNCTTSSPTGQPTTVVSPEILDYVSRPGSFSQAGDDGNLQFDNHDLVHAVAKLSSDINFSLYEFNFFIRPVVFFDQVYYDHELRFPDTTLSPAVLQYTDAQKDINAFTGIDILDANVGRTFEILGRSVGVKLGKQVLNWGESSLLLFNSLNTINPPDARRLRLPGLDLKEVLQPVGMFTINTDVVENVGLEMFYQYEWRGIQFDPVGAFQSPADIFGAGTGNKFSGLGQGRPPEDPFLLFRGIDTCDFTPGSGPPPTLVQGCVDSSGLLGSTSSRTVYVEETEPESGGQYGFVLKTFLEDFNNGTELSFYFANYHSRAPVLSFFAADDTCLGDDGAASALTFAVDCQYMGPGQPAGNEPLPVDTIRPVIEYPEDIHMYGVSFNTTIGDWALSGEYAFRTNLPVQVHSADVGFAALSPAFPAQDVNLGAVTIPGARSAVPAFVGFYRGYDCAPPNTNCIAPNQYIAGYEEMKSGQLGFTVLKLIGGDNPLNASQITFLLEMGMTHTLDFPELNQLQFNGGGTNTHISSGADGSPGTDPPAVDGNDHNVGLRQNVTSHKDLAGFGSEYAYGYRNINIVRWDDAIFGANLQGLAIIRHDVKGTSPGIAANFTEGRKQFNLGLSFDYLASYIGEVRYTWFTGGAFRDGERDKDNIFVTLGYQF